MFQSLLDQSDHLGLVIGLHAGLVRNAFVTGGEQCNRENLILGILVQAVETDYGVFLIVLQIFELYQLAILCVVVGMGQVNQHLGAGSFNVGTVIQECNLGTGGAIKTMLSVEGIVSTLDHVSGQSGTFQGQITLEILVLLPFLLKLNLVLSRISAGIYGVFPIRLAGNSRHICLGLLIEGRKSHDAHKNNQNCDNSHKNGN